MGNEQATAKTEDRENKREENEEAETEDEDEEEPVSFFDLMKYKQEQEKQGNSFTSVMKTLFPLSEAIMMFLKGPPGIPKTYKEQVQHAGTIIKVKPAAVKTFQTKIQQKYNFHQQGQTEVTYEILEKGIEINKKGSLSFNEVVKETIELDNKEINDMVLASKIGNWDLVWNTLNRKPYLVNCIPEQRAWSALHQAIFHGNLDVVRKLVEDYEADITICTKPDLAHAAEPGTDALTLAKHLDKKEIYDYLMRYTLEKNSAIKSQDISHFQLHRQGTAYPFRNYPLLQLTLASYKSLISPGHSFKEDERKHLVHMLYDILVHSAEEWEEAKIKICNTLYGVNTAQSDNLKDATDRIEFYRRVIQVYTAESNVYHCLTPALARQPNSPYKPLADDLAVAPFAIMLSAILMEWSDLKSYQQTTYRGVNIDVTSKYKVGETFLFSHFISSSKQKDVAERFRGGCGTLFIFDNTASKKWGPREIEDLSRCPWEAECLYPLGAEFEVVSVNKKHREVFLKLLWPST